jgi:hypothetical protein
MRFLTMITAVATVLLAAIGYWTLEASTRAWVGPVQATVSISDAGIVTINVTYKNSGREPAVDFGDDWADDWAASPSDSSINFDFYDNCKSDGNQGRCGERAARWKRENCDDKQVFQDRVAFPDFTYTHSKTGLKVDVSDHNKVVVVQGCFVYKSSITFFRPIHRTAFCYFYHVGQPENEMRACPVGNFAS